MGYPLGKVLADPENVIPWRKIKGDCNQAKYKIQIQHPPEQFLLVFTHEHEGIYGLCKHIDRRNIYQGGDIVAHRHACHDLEYEERQYGRQKGDHDLGLPGLDHPVIKQGSEQGGIKQSPWQSCRIDKKVNQYKWPV